MVDAVEYLRECGVFFVAAAGPHATPFSTAAEFEGHLYVWIGKDSPVYAALAADPRAEIAAVHPDKSWLSISGRLTEDSRPEAAAALSEAAREGLAPAASAARCAPFRLERGRAVRHHIMGETEEWTLP